MCLFLQSGSLDRMDRQEFSKGKLHAFRVLRELCSVRQLGGLCDGLVRLSDGAVKVSKAVLAAGCPYFRVLFEFEDGSQQALSRTAEPTLDITCATFELILDFIYTGKVNINNDNIEEILKTSDLLLMTDLKELCMQFLLGRIDVDNCLGVLQFAQQFSCPRLVQRVKEFVCDHFKHRQIVRTDEYRALSEERVKELLCQDGLSVKSEVDILTALVVWLNSNLSLTPNVESLVTTCLRESSDLNYDPKFQRALQDLRASVPPWDSPGAEMVRDALKKTRRIRSIRERGTKTVLACCDAQAKVYLVDILDSRKHSGSHVVMPPSLVPRIRPALVVEGGYLFALGGMRPGKERQMTSDVQRYDPATNTWMLMSPMPYCCCSPHVVSHAGKLYVMGGFNDEVELEIPNLEEFDIYTNKWRSLPPILNVRRGAAVAVAEGKIYYIGGTPWREPPLGSIYFHKVLDSVETFCMTEEVWMAGPPLKVRRSHAAAVAFDGTVYVIGGTRPIECPSAQGQLKVTGTEAFFHGSPGGWIEIPNFTVPNEAKLHTVAMANKDHILIVGCTDQTDAYRFNTFLMEGTRWSVPPGCESILRSGIRTFYSYALLTLPAAAMQELRAVETE
ncbi:Gigaxonin [Chionoecetes opilio]|uniref:Kelch-like protein diablo n=1 Tax=Chionoecetes opilio TaxID=41210 RepID=A0A8J5D557_CHIOP|nr:Gigaxonin [Chionoecetes opilio]